MFKWVLGTIFGIVLGIGIYFSFYLGAFKPVDPMEKSLGPLILLYKTHVGAYHKIVSLLNEVEDWAAKNNIPCSKTFGEFLDDPLLVEEGRRRAHCGCVVSLEGRTLSKMRELDTLFLPEGFRLKEIPLRKYVSVDFEGSPSIGPMKVYPKVMKYFETKQKSLADPVIEIYHVYSSTEMTTTYLFPMN